jgi:hypothetical protein
MIYCKKNIPRPGGQHKKNLQKTGMPHLTKNTGIPAVLKASGMIPSVAPFTGDYCAGRRTV